MGMHDGMRERCGLFFKSCMCVLYLSEHGIHMYHNLSAGPWLLPLRWDVFMLAAV